MNGFDEEKSPRTISESSKKCGPKKKEQSFLRGIRSYPKGVFFMWGNEFCERFSYYGMQAILTIYLTTEHHLSER
jgi:dipeptide/tripeptide permease